MILRLATATSVALGLALISFYLTEVGRAPWSGAGERHVRRMKERTAVPDHYEPVSFDDMAALPVRAPLSEYAQLERRAVSLEGYIQQFSRAPDGDYHLDIAPRVGSTGALVPYLSVEMTPRFQRASSTWTLERLAERFRPRSGSRTGWERPPRRVRVSGWLMYDEPYEGTQPPPGRPPHVTFWEIHPVTRLDVWNDSLARYEEFAR